MTEDAATASEAPAQEPTEQASAEPSDTTIPIPAPTQELVAQEAPDVWRLHLVGEPAIADKIAPSAYAHARIDDWNAAREWILARLADNIPAPAPQPV